MQIKILITFFLFAFILAGLAVAVVRETGLNQDPVARSNEETDKVIVPYEQDNYPPGDEESSFSDDPADQELAPVSLIPPNIKPHRLQVYYFHRTLRCTGCINVENASYEAVSFDHADAISTGLLEWHSVNYDEDENKHFVDEFDLYSQELIFIEMSDGNKVRAEKIPAVWQHWSDREKAREVVSKEIEKWLRRIRGQ